MKWKTRYGKLIDIEDMEEFHLINAICLMVKRKQFFNREKINKMLDVLFEEPVEEECKKEEVDALNPKEGDMMGSLVFINGKWTDYGVNKKTSKIYSNKSSGKGRSNRYSDPYEMCDMQYSGYDTSDYIDWGN